MKRTLTFTVKSVITSGTSGNGRDWTLWRLEAVDGEGMIIGETLKSFDDVPLNSPIEVELEPDEREDGAYLVRAKGHAKAKQGGSDAVRLADRIERLEGRMDWAVQKLLELDAAAHAPAPAPDNQPTLGADADDLEDIPFRRGPWPPEERVTRSRFRARGQWDNPS